MDDGGEANPEMEGDGGGGAMPKISPLRLRPARPFVPLGDVSLLHWRTACQLQHSSVCSRTKGKLALFFFHYFRAASPSSSAHPT